MKRNYSTIRVLALVMAICLVFVCFFTGCKSNEEALSDEYSYYVVNSGETNVTSNVGSASASGDKQSGTQAKGDNADKGGNTGGKGGNIVNNCYVSGDKIAVKPVEFKVMIRDHANGLAKYNDSEFAAYVKKRFGITLKFTVVNINSVSEQVSLAYSGKNSLPDMFWGMAGTRSLHTPFIATKEVVNLSPYIEKYAPNVKKMFKEQPDTKYLATYDDGNIYYIPMYNETENYSWKFFINKTWLKNLKLSMPTTVDEFHDVLAQFKKGDANKNGNASDEIPLIIAAGEPGIGQIPLSLFSPFGLYSYTNAWCLNSNNKVQYAFATEEYRNGLRFYRKLYEEGLLYSAFRGATYSQIKQWTGSNTQTVGVFAANNYSEGTDDESFLKNYMVLNPLKKNAKSNAKWLKTPFENVWSDWFVMTNACKYPEIAMRLINWLYSEEGTMVAMNGPDGKNKYWNYDSKGNIVINEKNIPSGKSKNEYTYSMTPGYPIPHYNSAALSQKVSAATSSSAAAKMYSQQLNTMFKNRAVIGFPQLYFTSKEQSATKNEYKSEAINMQWSFLGGTASIDNDWDSYIKRLNKLGLDTEKTIYQNAYNRYLAWKKNNK